MLFLMWCSSNDVLSNFSHRPKWHSYESMYFKVLFRIFVVLVLHFDALCLKNYLPQDALWNTILFTILCLKKKYRDIFYVSCKTSELRLKNWIDDFFLIVLKFVTKTRFLYCIWLNHWIKCQPMDNLHFDRTIILPCMLCESRFVQFFFAFNLLTLAFFSSF